MERIKGVAGWHKVVSFEHRLGLGLGEPCIKLCLGDIEKQFDELGVVDLAKDTTGQVTPFRELRLYL